MGFKKMALKGLNWCSKHSPELMIGASIVAGGAALFFTVKGTMKLDKVLEEHDERVNNVKKNYIPEDKLQEAEGSDEPVKLDVDLTEEEVKEYRKDLTKEYITTVGHVALAYAPAIALAASSAALSIGAHTIMRKRLIVAVSALESVSAAFAEYRNRVKDAYGEEAEHDILIGKKVEKIQTEVVGKNGKTKTVEEEVVTYADGLASPYARYFDKYNTKFLCSDEYTDGRYYNKSFLEGAEKTANLLLRTNGYLFLNDVYELLGFEKTGQGQLVGWIDMPETVGLKGDGFVDFHLTDPMLNGDAMNYDDDVWLLDFNVDGVIVDKIS